MWTSSGGVVWKFNRQSGSDDNDDDDNDDDNDDDVDEVSCVCKCCVNQDHI